MPKIRYKKFRFTPQKQALIDHINTILGEYAALGIDITVRTLFYRLVASAMIPNKQTEYKRLVSIVNDARLDGQIDWHHLSDITRNVRSLGHWESPGEIVRACASQYRVDLWRDQPVRVEVWIEKDAQLGNIERVCQENDVPYFSCRGYTSQSEMWGASQRILRYMEQGQRCHIIHLGDHDPSGIDMSRDIQDRLALFTRYRADGPVVHRIALNMDQIEEYDPPPNPVKFTDSRATGYEEEFGDESWELDALPPLAVGELIQEKINEFIDEDTWNVGIARQDEGRARLKQVAETLA